ncbi:hypothetical protein TEA_020583 [Camellia sinensis var. sinensis]|uniref:Protein arginine N-methyltransferase domain-containing protein n=1 Tax=Camellia sinensis var. sinensis TaxID=542762 RepID=A0A4S4EJW7_CAMSN|nr:hypothetical protein TEA_020583 [Camellia sinensis var. sinensis]
MKCRDQLHELVKEEIEKKDSSTEEWKIAMERSFNRMDNEAEAKAKKMEEEMYRLPESLEERNGQLQASASTAGMVEFTEPGICHGFVLWIDWVMDIDNSIVLSTGPDKRYWKQGIKLLAKPVTVGIHGSRRGNISAEIEASFNPSNGEIDIKYAFT